MKLITKLMLLSFAFSLAAPSFAGEEVISAACKESILKSLKKGSISVSAEVRKALYGNSIAPISGAVCKDKVAYKVKAIDDQTAEVKVIVNPWSGPIKGLRADCDEAPLKKYPVNTVTVKTASCDFEMTDFSFDFNLDD